MSAHRRAMWTWVSVARREMCVKCLKCRVRWVFASRPDLGGAAGCLGQHTLQQRPLSLSSHARVLLKWRCDANEMRFWTDSSPLSQYQEPLWMAQSPAVKRSPQGPVIEKPLKSSPKEMHPDAPKKVTLRKVMGSPLHILSFGYVADVALRNIVRLINGKN